MEEMAVFKSYLRNLKRILLELKKAIEEDDKDQAMRLIKELIEDTNSGIED